MGSGRRSFCSFPRSFRSNWPQKQNRPRAAFRIIADCLAQGRFVNVYVFAVPPWFGAPFKPVRRTLRWQDVRNVDHPARTTHPCCQRLPPRGSEASSPATPTASHHPAALSRRVDRPTTPRHRHSKIVQRTAAIPREGLLQGTILQLNASVGSRGNFNPTAGAHADNARNARRGLLCLELESLPRERERGAGLEFFDSVYTFHYRLSG